MKRKILGVFIALCMVCAFVGCDDPVSEKPIDEPSINYKDSGFVGMWVCINEEGDVYGKYTMNYTYILTGDGKGIWTGSVVSGDAVPYDDRYIAWTPLVNGEVHLEYVDWYTGSTIQETGTLSEDGLELTVGKQVYVKVSEGSLINYKDSSFVGTWVDYGIRPVGSKPYTWKDIYTFYENGEGQWKRESLGDVYEEPYDRTVFWFPLLNGDAQLIETREPTGVYKNEGSLKQDGAILSVGSQDYERVNENADTIYTESGFVGAWVSKNVKPWGSTNGLFITIFILNEDGTGIRREDVIPGNADGIIDERDEPEEGSIEYVQWHPLSNGTVSFEYNDPLGGASKQEIGTLAEGSLSFTLEDGSDYTKQ